MKGTNRKLFLCGNWKSNNTLQDTLKLTTTLLNPLEFNQDRLDVMITPPTIHIPELRNALENRNVLIGCQHICRYGFGPYTGETSAMHLADYDVQWALVGHSERRTLFGETVVEVAEKTAFALENRIRVVLCMGETYEERRNEQTLDVVLEQLSTVKKHVNDLELWKGLVISYEPVWAIGTGKVASPQQAQHVHKFIRRWLLDHMGNEVANSVRIIYGGSITASNCRPLLTQKDIDGFLVGGASLLPIFKDIVKIADGMV